MKETPSLPAGPDRVLVVYTGGTIGSMPRDPEDSTSPLVTVSWDEFRSRTSSLNPALADGRPNARYIGFPVDGASLEPLDSCNIGADYWTAIAGTISQNYDRYAGFVVLHGTDTMVYTASALSLMLENLAKPVVLTGAQLSHLHNIRNDALQNLLTALQFANPALSGLPLVPEVSVFFGDVLLRGNRARKVTASGFNAFESPDYPLLARAGERIIVHDRAVRPAPTGPLRLRTHLEPNVVAISFFPGIQQGSLLPHILGDESLRGIVLKTYGMGTVPSDERVLGPIAAAVRRGVVVVAVTQCFGGRVDLGRYEAGSRLLEAGVISGFDITPEAALVKLMVLLGDPDLSPDVVRRLFQQDLAGELTVRQIPA
ncbi:MAG: asparaginase [bacterium]